MLLIFSDQKQSSRDGNEQLLLLTIPYSEEK